MVVLQCYFGGKGDSFGAVWLHLSVKSIMHAIKTFTAVQWIIMASLTYVCFVPAKGLVRDLSANSSNIAFEVPLASKW